MNIFVASLLSVAAASSHDKITKQEFDSESRGKFVFMELGTSW